MVKGLTLFRERFLPFQGLMTLIGGAACDEWFTTNGLTFRATNDLDLVIIFRLAATLPGEAGPELAASIRTDLITFLEYFPLDSTEWPAIIASLEATFGAKLQPAALLAAVQTYFHLQSPMND
jgi:hypothetical protein